MIDSGGPVVETRMFGPYRLESLLGRGGMGDVHRAYDTGKDRIVAVKLLSPALSADSGFQARFRRESRVAARLREPHIIPIHDFGEIDGRLFIDMRLVDGADLGSLLLREGPLDPARAVHIVGQVAAALDAAHAESLIHRDIKPSNVIVTGAGPDEFAYLIDFGIARNLLGTTTGAVVGSLAYMAPERFANAGVEDARIDVYGLGCLLHELLTGQRPFPAEEPAPLMFAHISTRPPRPSAVHPGVPPGLDDVVTRALAKNPDDRYPGAGALATAARTALVTRGQLDPAGAPTISAAPANALTAPLGSSMPADPHRNRSPSDRPRRPADARRRLSGWPGWTVAALAVVAVTALSITVFTIVRTSAPPASTPSSVLPPATAPSPVLTPAAAAPTSVLPPVAAPSSVPRPAAKPSAVPPPAAKPSAVPPPTPAPTKERVLDIPAGGPLFSNDDAAAKAPGICADKGGTWNGRWNTVVENEFSVVSCTFEFGPTQERVLDIPAGGPLFSNDDATAKSPAICAKVDGTWNGQWHTVVQGEYSVVSCTFGP